MWNRKWSGYWNKNVWKIENIFLFEKGVKWIINGFFCISCLLFDIVYELLLI